MKKLKDKNVYILIITILFASLIINIVGIIMHIKNANPYNRISHQTNFSTTVDAPKAFVYATLKDNDKGFLEGFGPREVNLNYGHTDVDLEIQNKDKTTKTYKLVINKPDKRDTENRLASLSTSAKKINFNPNQYSYNINVGANVESIYVNSSLMSDKSHYVYGYEPRKIDLQEGLNVAFIRTKSEAGEEKDYKINIFKSTNNEEIEEDNSLDLDSLSLSVGQINFKKDKLSYRVKVANEVDEINVYAFAKNKKAEVNVSDTKLNEGKNEILIDVKYNNESKTYKVIVNREKKVIQDNDKKLKELIVSGYNIHFNPDKFNYDIVADANRNLIISAYPYLNDTDVTIIGNEQNKKNKTIKLLVTNVEGKYNTYQINIKDKFWNIKNEVIAVAVTFIGGLFILSLLKYYEMKTTKKKRKKRAKK